MRLHEFKKAYVTPSSRLSPTPPRLAFSTLSITGEDQKSGGAEQREDKWKELFLWLPQL